MNRLILTLLLGSGLLGGGWADPVPESEPKREGEPRREERGKPKGHYFATMLRGLDADKDRAISFEEFSSGERASRLPEEVQRRLFSRLDKDGDGQIRRDEIPRGHDSGPGRPFDPNQDGKVTFEEFRQNPRLSKMPDRQLRELFAKMDRDNDGILGPKDWKGRRPGSGPKRPPGGGPQGLASLDEDGNGSLSFEEFRSGPRMKDRPEEVQREAFRKLDRDGSGTIERQELHHGGPRPGGKGDRGAKTSRLRP